MFLPHSYNAWLEPFGFGICCLHSLVLYVALQDRLTGDDRLANQSYGQLTLAKDLTSDLEQDFTSP
ncbi:hypothetical protein [uncultured Ilumatobacter sp.]|uniref:hypothetical protein n=1 Tax=uncultured Ilumatobacter sp. TaxID=879968 RepID=UPI00374E9F34